MAGARKKNPTETIRISVSAKLYEYLGHLARTTTMGASENDVALHVLTEQLEVMRKTAEYAYRLDDKKKRDAS